MLGKLIKHEWKETYKVNCMLLAVLAVTTLLGFIALRSVVTMGQTDMLQREPGFSFVWLIICIFTLGVYVLAMCSVSVGCYVYLCIHFYKSMYGAEGYLTHTLPVSKHKLLCSKIFVGGIWVMLLITAMYASILTLVSLSIPELNMAAVIRELSTGIAEIAAELKNDYGVNLTQYGILFLVTMIIGPFTSMMIVFGSISLGQLFPKVRILMAFVIYFGLAIVMGIIRSAFSGVLNTYSMVAASNGIETLIRSTFGNQMYVTMAEQLIVAALLYFASWWVCSRKLNLE
ncbi:MAG: hypothetical protein MJ114_05215 [Acetatifactor sp.]|nr:hypothetical protein [Acetatifactor sp.]